MKVDVWPVALDAAPAVVDELLATLADDERGRAERYATPLLRTRFIVARGALRALAASYLGRDATAIAFVYSDLGKPSLVDGGVDFNLTHSDELALFAFARGGEIGVDVEKIRPMTDVLGIARRYFTTNEWSELAALDPDARLTAFFRCWTRKEAYLKAIGDGIDSLNSFEVTLVAGHPPAIRHIGGDSTAAARWQLRELAPSHGYIGAIAAIGPAELLCRQTMTADALLARLRDDPPAL